MRCFETSRIPVESLHAEKQASSESVQAEPNFLRGAVSHIKPAALMVSVRVGSSLYGGPVVVPCLCGQCGVAGFPVQCATTESCHPIVAEGGWNPSSPYSAPSDHMGVSHNGPYVIYKSLLSLLHSSRASFFDRSAYSCLHFSVRTQGLRFPQPLLEGNLAESMENRMYIFIIKVEG